MSATSCAASDIGARLESYFSPAAYTKLIRRNLTLGSVEDVEDAVQKVMLKIYERAMDGSLPELDNLDAFIQRSVRNALLDNLGSRATAAASLGADHDAWDNLIESEAKSFCARPVAVDEALGWKQTYDVLFSRLPAKWTEVARMAMLGASPAEISDRFDGQDGYGLRAYARKLIAKILTDLDREGDENSAVLLRSLRL